MIFYLLSFLLLFPVSICADQPANETQEAASLNYFERTSLLVKSLFNNFGSTGTIAPTSSFAINELLTPLKGRDKNKKIRVLEVGFGEGCITRALLPELGPNDEYFGVELDENLFKAVEEECKGKNRKFLCGPVESCNLPRGMQFDFIISTVPLSTIPTEPVKGILKREKELLKQGGTLSYIAYWLSFKVMGAVNLLKGSETSKSHDEKMDFIKEWRTHFDWTETNVHLNLPPVSVFHGIKKK